MTSAEILLTGVGGQGIISVGRILLQTGLEEGLQIRGSETHGMSQRGGSVVFHVRVGDYKAVLIPEGGADIIIATEPMELLRNIKYLKKDGIAITSTHKMIPPISAVIKQPYAELDDVFKSIKHRTKNLLVVPAEKIADELDNARGENIILLGAMNALSKLFDEKVIKEVIKARWPKVAGANLTAYAKGYEFALANEFTN